MNTVTEKKTEFKPILLHKDEKRIQNSLKQADENAEKLNAALEEALQFVDDNLTDSGKEALLKDGFKHAMELVRKNYQFPKADDDFNLKSIGKDPEPAKRALLSAPAWFSGFKYAVKGGKVILSAEGREEIVQRCCSYTEHEKQNEVYNDAKGICEVLNKAYVKGYIKADNQTPIQNGIALVKFVGGESPFIPNPKIIQRYRPDGGIESFY